jgi:predicted nucleotidyltransferase
MTLWLGNVVPEPVQAILLFGSRARGDADCGSDTDFAVFADVGSTERLAQVKEGLCSDLRDTTVNVSVYSGQTAEIMAREGSLFLWHLKLEGRPIFRRDAWIDHLLAGVAPYQGTKALRDIGTFERVLEDVAESIASTEQTILFEAATLFSVLRSIGMIVTALVERPCFGRLEPVTRLTRIMRSDFPLDQQEVQRLLAAKLIYSRKIPDATVDLTGEWCQGVAVKIARVAGFARGIANGELHKSASDALRR